MTLRMVQIFLPPGQDQGADDLLEGRAVLAQWMDENGTSRRVIQVLVAADQTEGLMDRFDERYGGAEGFTIVLFPVEAVLPRPKLGNDGPHVPNEDQADRDAQTHEGEDHARRYGRVSREELLGDLVSTLGVNRVFLAMTIFSSVVAAVGLVRSDVAVLVGAMVIAPLLGPNIAMALAATLGDLDLLRRAALTNAVGMGVTLAFALAVGMVFEIDPTVPAIESRTRLGMGDLILALAAGSAGTFAFTRGIAGTMIGVMVAVALMPPLVTLGMLLGRGEMDRATSTALLVATNVVCVNVAAVATFMAQGVRPRTWWEGKRAKQATRIAMVAWLVLLGLLTTVLVLREKQEAKTRDETEEIKKPKP